MVKDFQEWVKSLEVASNSLEYWASTYDTYASDLDFPLTHCDPPGVVAYRDALLQAAKRILIQGKPPNLYHASRLYLWTVESHCKQYDGVQNTDFHPYRITIATIHELGCIFLTLSGSPKFISFAQIENQIGGELHRTCGRLRAKIRQYFDQIDSKILRQSSVFSQFVGIDLWFAFEWKGSRLHYCGTVLQRLLRSIEARGFAPPKPDLPKAASEGLLRSALTNGLHFLHDAKVAYRKAVPARNVELPPTLAVYPHQFWEEIVTPLNDMRVKIEGAKPRPIVLLTANQTEQETALKYLEALEGGKVFCSNFFLTHLRLGRLGGRPVLLMQTEMGSAGFGGSQATLHNLLETFDTLQCIISVGVCFGVDPKKQKFGDIAVAEIILPYENQKIHPGVKAPDFRNYPIYAGQILRDAFGGATSFEIPGSNRIQQVRTGAVLSGEKLIDSISFRERLLGKRQQIVGGEMEGSGIYSAAFGRPGVQAILVKSFCDFADGVKSDAWHEYCSRMSLEYCLDVFHRHKHLLDISSLRAIDNDVALQPVAQKKPS